MQRVDRDVGERTGTFTEVPRRVHVGKSIIAAANIFVLVTETPCVRVAEADLAERATLDDATNVACRREQVESWCGYQLDTGAVARLKQLVRLIKIGGH